VVFCFIKESCSGSPVKTDDHGLSLVILLSPLPNITVLSYPWSYFSVFIWDLLLLKCIYNIV